MLKAYQSLLKVKTSEVGLGLVMIVYLGRCSVVKTLVQYQVECELLQTFLKRNWQCAATGIFIEPLLYARHLTLIILNTQMLDTTHVQS